MKKNIKTAKGFTLVEAIVSVLLFSIVMVVFSTLLSTGLTIHKKALNTTEKSMRGARHIAQNKGTQLENGKVIIKIDGENWIEVDGKYCIDYKAEDEEKKNASSSKFYKFIPNP